MTHMMTPQAVFRMALLSLWFVTQATSVQGQDSIATSNGGFPDSSPACAREVGLDRAVSIRTFPSNFLQDQKTIWTFPTQLAHGEHWKPTLGFLAGTAALVALDPHDTPYFRRTQSFGGFNRALSGRNTVLTMTAVPASFYIVGLARKDSYSQHTALLAGEAAADAEILAVLMKDASKRLRPSDIPPHGNFSDTWFESRGSVLGTYAGFPSGHTILAFSMATVFAERYRKHRWVPWVSYGLASLVGFSRLTQQAHFPSDVFAGAALGYFISHGVVLQNH